VPGPASVGWITGEDAVDQHTSQGDKPPRQPEAEPRFQGADARVGEAGRAGLAREIGKRDAFASLEQEALLSLLRTASELTEPFDALFARHGLSQPSHNVLRIVAGHEPGGVTCQTIGEHLISRGPDVTRLIDRLKARGLVSRGACDRDARRRIIRLTDEGRQLVERLRPEVDELHRRQFAHLGREDLASLIALLQRARDAERQRRKTDGDGEQADARPVPCDS